MFACMEASSKIYALLASVSRTQLLISWIGKGLKLRCGRNGLLGTIITGYISVDVLV